MKKAKMILMSILLVFTFSMLAGCGTKDDRKAADEAEKDTDDKGEDKEDDAEDNAPDNVTDNTPEDGAVDGNDNMETVPGTDTTVQDGTDADHMTAGDGQQDGNIDQNNNGDGTVSGELGNAVKDIGDGVGDAVEDTGDAVGNAVEGR